VSTAGPSLIEQIETQELVTAAYFTSVYSRIDEHRRRTDARLRSAREHRSPDDLRTAQVEFQRVRGQLDPVRGLSRVKSLPAPSRS
jgi:hypothetical protein